LFLVDLFFLFVHASRDMGSAGCKDIYMENRWKSRLLISQGSCGYADQGKESRWKKCWCCVGGIGVVGNVERMFQ
jgi:hypothetical protein